ncbi:MAG: porin family protein [Planctomycetes bacterium]|nr:porin family protein [Planctomycetota bacterium]
MLESHALCALAEGVSDLLRLRIIAAVTMLLSVYAVLRAEDELPISETPADASSYPETWSTDWQTVPGSELPVPSPGAPPQHSQPSSDELAADSAYDTDDELSIFWPKPKWFGLRHSTTHGRHVGRGSPLGGTSWRNRPFYVGGEIGTMWLTQSIDENVSRDVDTFGGVFAGWDWDHYWGGELHFDWSTPELKNSEAPDADRTDSLFTWNYNFLYYPWGDAKFRPYWRAGIGNTHFDFPLDDGSRHDEWMWTFPLGIGVKYPVRRWLAARAELADHLTFDDDYPTQHNVTLTFGLEWRFGAHPPSYWPWNPSRHIW